MTRAFRAFAAVCITIPATACESITGSDNDGARITTDQEARTAFTSLRYVGQQVDGKVPVNFPTPFSVAGTTGTASVTGRKTTGSNSSLSSLSTTRTADLMIELSGFKSAATSTVTVTGRIKWYDYYYSRTSCTSSGFCASASDHSESMSGTGIKITFEHGGVMYSDEISIEANSGADTSFWNVKLTTRSGQSFSFTMR